MSYHGMSKQEREAWEAEVMMPDGTRRTVREVDGWLGLAGGTLPKDTKFPEYLQGLMLEGGTLPPGVQLPQGLNKNRS